MSEVSQLRRKSVDIGGLALALGEDGRGNGWGGWDEDEISEAIYAELLSDMYTQTQSAVNFHFSTFTPVVIHGQTRERLIEFLDSWNFEPNKLPEEEVLTCTYILFESLMCREGMQNDTSISLSQIGSFLSHLRDLYRRQNSYHNFRHALDVLQAIHVFLYSAGVVPPVSILMLCVDARRWKPDKTISSRPYISCLGNEDLFALYVAAIGHDVGHPGFTNAFMKNAKTPLSLVYDNQSALEQMHYALLLSIMRYHGLGTLLDRPQTGPAFRKLLYKTLLATDMSVHCEFMDNFDAMVSGQDVGEARQKVLICQALIKCADISNPGRPHKVSKQWATALMDEWTRQAHLEKHLHLPPSVTPSDDPLVEARSQVFFISSFTKPLFLLVANAIPQMRQFGDWCQENLDIWERRMMEMTKNNLPAKKVNGNTASYPHTTEDFITAFPLTLPSILLNEEPHSDADNFSADSRPSSSASDKRSDEAPSVRNTSPSPASCPSSPYEVTLSTLSISRPDTSMSHSAHSSKSTVSTISESATAIRAAYKASVRKKKSFHRTSWNPGPVSTSENFPLGGHQLKSSVIIGNGASLSSTSSPDTSSPNSKHFSPLASLPTTISPSHCRTSKRPSFSALASPTVYPTS